MDNIQALHWAEKVLLSKITFDKFAQNDIDEILHVKAWLLSIDTLDWRYGYITNNEIKKRMNYVDFLLNILMSKIYFVK